jgi:mannose-6-phosphate isomerase-like protein (cupin superfamily)
MLDVVDPAFGRAGGEMATPIDIFASPIELCPGGAVQERGWSGDTGLWTVAAFHATDNGSVHSDVWELHPAGDEMLFLLSGAITVHWRGQAGDEVVMRALTAGACLVVPAGRWHRLTVEEPGDLVAITPRANTAYQVASQ